VLLLRSGWDSCINSSTVLSDPSLSFPMCTRMGLAIEIPPPHPPPVTERDLRGYGI
jgi:hypothetical protein